jgi:hypothetical protein
MSEAVLETQDEAPQSAGVVTHVAWFALATLTVCALSAPMWKLAAAVMGA